MQRIWFLPMLSIFWIIACESSPSDLGIGLVHFENDFTTVVEFYDKPDDSSKSAFWISLIYEKDSVVAGSSLKKEDLLKFRPIYLRSRKSVLVLRLLEQKNEWLRVITDETNKQEHWIKAEEAKIEIWP